MFGITIGGERAAGKRWRAAGTIIDALSRALAPLRRIAAPAVQQGRAPVVALLSRLSRRQRAVAQRISPLGGATAPAGTWRDRLRQALNLLLSIAQWAAAGLIFTSQFGDDLFYDPTSRDPLIVPADYTFAIWAFIFPASVAYGVYQALPQQRTNDLLRRIGFQTAFAFGCITLWSVATLFDPLRYTVPLFFGALWGLIFALYQISRHARPLSTAERLLVGVPLGVYAAWCTVGTIANSSTSLAGLGYTELILGEQTWAVIMLLAAGVISAWMTTVSRGPIAYALGIIWALIGVVVANITERSNGTVALTAGLMAALVGLAMLRARGMIGAQAEPART